MRIRIKQFIFFINSSRQVDGLVFVVKNVESRQGSDVLKMLKRTI